MNWQFTPHAVPLFVGVAALLGVMWFALRHRSVRGAPTMILVCGSALFYIAGYAFELGSQTLAEVRFWLRVEYIGATLGPSLLFILITKYTGTRQPPTALKYTIYLIIPVITIVFAWTNDYYQPELIWRGLEVVTRFPTTVEFTPGVWYWVHAAYMWGISGSGIILLIRAYRRHTGLYRRQIRTFLIGMAIPLGLYLIYLARILPTRIDLIPYGISITAIAFALAIFSHQFLDIMPVAHETIFASMSDAVIVLDTHSRVLALNPAAHQLLGLEPEQTIGRPASTAFARVPGILQARRSGHSPIEVATQRDGEEQFLEVRSSSLSSGPGKFEGYLLVVRDITQTKRAENTLRQVNERLESLRLVDAELTQKLDVKFVAMMALDAAMRISNADAAVIGLTEDAGTRVISVLGSYPDALINQLLPTDRGIVKRVIQHKQAELVADLAADADYYAIAPGMQAQITAPLISREKLIGVLALETTEAGRFTPQVYETLKLLVARVAAAIDNAYMYEARQRLIEELNAFGQTVAHDLKNPLAIIGGYASLIDEEYDTLPDSEKRELVRCIVHGAAKANDIIEALLLFAGVRTMKGVTIGQLDMKVTVDETLRRLANMIAEYGTQLELPDNWPPALGYAPWIEEIWVNYLSNAIKYGGRPPRIVLGYDIQADGKIRYWVRDNGRGLTPEQQAKLFTPFTRLEQAAVEGHGLGLSIVQRIAARLRGEVGVESEPGHGSLFYFTLPAAEAQVAVR